MKPGDKAHYCLIQNLNRFLHRSKTSKQAFYYCPYCLHGFIRQELLDMHFEHCSTNGPQKVQLPKPGENILEFKDFQKPLGVPFVCYADSESINKPMQDGSHISQQDPCVDPKYTKKTNNIVCW